jgi:hypothetical protein
VQSFGNGCCSIIKCGFRNSDCGINIFKKSFNSAFIIPHSAMEKEMEAVQEKVDAAQVAPSKFPGFEPEILAFCCEH